MATADRTEQILQDLGIKYECRADDTFFVPCDIDLSEKGLVHLPDLSSVHVGGSFLCHRNKLASLEGAPASVGEDFSCTHNNLINLKGAPASVGNIFACGYNQLSSLEGAPAVVGGDFMCRYNHLTHLEHAPKTFSTLQSDLGNFMSWGDIPEDIRTSPETRARIKKEALVQKNTALQKPVKTIRRIGK